jgi:YVTN family beta-propeller protein
LRHRTILWVAFLLCALFIAGCGAGTGASIVKPTATTVMVTPTSLPSAGKIVATISGVGGTATPGYIYGMAADSTAVWVHNSEQGTVVRVDPTTNQVVATIHVGHGLGDVVLQGGFVWVGNHDDSTVSKIDPKSNKVVDTIALPPPTGFLGTSPGTVWVASKGNSEVMKIDPSTDKVVTSVMVPGGPTWSSFGARSLWICIHDSSAVGLARMDLTTNNADTTIDIGSTQGYSCGGVAASDSGVWVELLDSTQTYDLGMARIDPATNKVVATIILPQSSQTSTLAVDGQGVWSAVPDLGLLYISTKTNQATGFLSMQDPYAIAVGAGSVWVMNSQGSLMRVTPGQP